MKNTHTTSQFLILVFLTIISCNNTGSITAVKQTPPPSHTQRMLFALKVLNLEDIDDKGKTTLHHAAKFGDLKLAIVHSTAEAHTINQKDHLGNTPLHYATLKNHPKIIEYLLKNGADPLAHNNTGQRAVDIAKTPEIAALIQNTTPLQTS